MRNKNALIDPYYIGIEDESINPSLSDSQVQGTDEEHQQESSSYKENEECQVVVVGAVDAVGRSNSQAIALLAATTQSASTVERTLGVKVTRDI